MYGGHCLNLRLGISGPIFIWYFVKSNHLWHSLAFCFYVEMLNVHTAGTSLIVGVII